MLYHVVPSVFASLAPIIGKIEVKFDKNVILANTCLQNTWKSSPAKIWPPLLPKKSSKIKKYDEILAYWIQVHGEDFHLGYEVGQGPRSSIKCFLGPSKNIIGVEIDSWPRFGHIFVRNTFSKLPKTLWKWKISMEFKLSLKATKKRWPKANMRWQNKAFCQKTSLWHLEKFPDQEFDTF